MSCSKSETKNVAHLDGGKKVTTRPTRKRHQTGYPDETSSSKKRNRKNVQQRGDESTDILDTPPTPRTRKKAKSVTLPVDVNENDEETQQLADLERAEIQATIDTLNGLSPNELKKMAMGQLFSISQLKIEQMESQLKIAQLELEVYRFRSLDLHEKLPKPELKRLMARKIGSIAQLKRQLAVHRLRSKVLFKTLPKQVKDDLKQNMKEMKKKKPSEKVATETASTSADIVVSSTTNFEQVPLSFAMQSPNVASDVPQRGSDQGPAPANYVAIDGSNELANEDETSKLQNKSDTPVISTNNQRPQAEENRNTSSMLTRTHADTPPIHKKVSSSDDATVEALPGGLPNVIVQTEDSEKEMADASAGQLNAHSPMPKPKSKLSNVFPKRGSLERVESNSTTLNQTNNSSNIQPLSSSLFNLSHPAPLPESPAGPSNSSWKPVAPKPSLRIKRFENSIVLTWDVQTNQSHYANISSYEVFGYKRESAEKEGPPRIDGSNWKRIVETEDSECSLCQSRWYNDGVHFHFAVRAIDVHGRPGPFSDPKTYFFISDDY